MANRMFLGLLALALVSGFAFAITGATTSGATQTRWSGSVTAGNVATQGGNITSVNVASTALTSKWASFYGNISGTIVLGNATTSVYSWTYATSNGGEVCVSTNSSEGFASPTNGTTAAIDTAFNTTGSPDNAAGTFNTTCSTLNISTGNMTGFIAARTQGSSTFTTCAGTSGGTAVGNYYFCTNVNSSGTNYIGSSANFELIAPAGAAAGTTYYFYAQLS